MNRDIQIKSERYRVVGMKKQTTAKVFENIRLGDVLTFSTNLGCSAYSKKTLKTTIGRTSQSVEKTFVELNKLLDNFYLEIATEENRIEFKMEK